MIAVAPKTNGRRIAEQIAIWLGFLAAYQLVRGMVRGGEGVGSSTPTK